ncbi:hypothetical protein RISK_005960 [Rhodopirellula islandica]|uniref:Uncharacterized protein n=1 Tax=Rhodopirellula islandica TaxID=595434 RepID=A0A0J1B5B4_RHOIS|nr:hypothetical protein RISK_005960 [Rhodopirellula islandica]
MVVRDQEDFGRFLGSDSSGIHCPQNSLKLPSRHSRYFFHATPWRRTRSACYILVHGLPIFAAMPTENTRQWNDSL